MQYNAMHAKQNVKKNTRDAMSCHASDKREGGWGAQHRRWWAEGEGMVNALRNTYAGGGNGGGADITSWWAQTIV